MEFEYRRGGTLACFAAYDVHHARVMGTIADTTSWIHGSDTPNEVLLAALRTPGNGGGVYGTRRTAPVWALVASAA